MTKAKPEPRIPLTSVEQTGAALVGCFRKKPVAIEARQLSRENGPEVADWCGGSWHSLYGRGDRGEDISNVLIRTLEGEMRAYLGNWIIKGTHGEFYPVRADIFAANYEAVPTTPAPVDTAKGGESSDTCLTSAAPTGAPSAMTAARREAVTYIEQADCCSPELVNLAEQFLSVEDMLEESQTDKDVAYDERNRLVALLASMFPAGIALTDIPDWLPEWHGCVYVDLPNGQASWHFHDSHAHLFAHLPPYTKPWDGHTTAEKYDRIRALALTNGAEVDTTEVRHPSPLQSHRAIPSPGREEWQPIETAPKNGQHIWALNADATHGFGYFDGAVTPLATTVHWFATEVGDGEWYPSVNHDGDMVQPFHATHWQPIRALKAPSP